MAERARLVRGGVVALAGAALSVSFAVLPAVLPGVTTAASAAPTAASAMPSGPPASGYGYLLADADGGVTPFEVPGEGAASTMHLNAPVVGMAADPVTGGYWLVASDGGVFAYDAPFYGSAATTHLSAPIVGMAFDPLSGGYWLVGADGGVFAYGAPFDGSAARAHLSAPVVGMAFDLFTGGYWLVGADGGVFAYDAPFFGSAGGMHLNEPIVGVGADPVTGGYWLVASDGGVFAYGAPFHGSATTIQLNAPVVGMASDPATGGYWLVASDGGVFAYDAPFYGSASGTGCAICVSVGPPGVHGPTVVGMAASPTLSPIPAASAEGQAQQILGAAQVPPGATSVGSLPGSAFAQPWASIGCMPLVDESAYWTTPDSPQDVVSFLEANAPAWIPNEGSGVLGGPAGIISYGVIDHAVGPGWDRDQLVFTVAVTGDGSTGIRADAEVIPPNAMCVTAAG